MSNLSNIRQSIRDMHFLSEQDLLNLLFTLSCKTATSTSIDLKLRDILVDSLDDVINTIENHIETVESDIQLMDKYGELTQAYIDNL